MLFGGNDRATEAYVPGTRSLEILSCLLALNDVNAQGIAGLLEQRDDVGDIVTSLTNMSERSTAAEAAVIRPLQRPEPFQGDSGPVPHR